MNQYVEIENSHLILSRSEVNLSEEINLSLIKEGCRVCNIPYIGGGTIFVNKNNNELDQLKIYIEKQLHSNNYVIMYSKLIKYHPQYSYYNIIAIRSSNINDLKKVIKIQKMKAFL